MFKTILNNCLRYTIDVYVNFSQKWSLTIYVYKTFKKIFVEYKINAKTLLHYYINNEIKISIYVNIDNLCFVNKFIKI